MGSVWCFYDVWQKWKFALWLSWQIDGSFLANEHLNSSPTLWRSVQEFHEKWKISLHVIFEILCEYWKIVFEILFVLHWQNLWRKFWKVLWNRTNKKQSKMVKIITWCSKWWTTFRIQRKISRWTLGSFIKKWICINKTRSSWYF